MKFPGAGIELSEWTGCPGRQAVTSSKSVCGRCKGEPPPPPQEVAGADEVRAASSEPSAVQRQLSVTFDEDNRVIYQFFNQDTRELVQQVPSEDVLRVARNISDLLDDEDGSRGGNLNIYT